MSDQLQLDSRDARGKRRNSRMRLSGRIPGIVYGHQEEPKAVSICAEQLQASLRHGAKVVELSGVESGQALLQDVQWDAFQQHVLHVDLLRVDASERVEVEVPLLLRGEAPGEHDGGVVEHLVHHVEIETSPVAIPESLHININQLALNGSLTVGDIVDLPEGAKLVTDPKLVAVQCVEPAAEEEEEAAETAGAEPELIGRKATDEEEGEED
jgi:large subunit ribosomal protein L25